MFFGHLKKIEIDLSIGFWSYRKSMSTLTLYDVYYGFICNNTPPPPHRPPPPFFNYNRRYTTVMTYTDKSWNWFEIKTELQGNNCILYTFGEILSSLF